LSVGVFGDEGGHDAWIGAVVPILLGQRAVRSRDDGKAFADSAVRTVLAAGLGVGNVRGGAGWFWPASVTMAT
jgi:hypothetical protein